MLELKQNEAFLLHEDQCYGPMLWTTLDLDGRLGVSQMLLGSCGFRLARRGLAKAER